MKALFYWVFLLFVLSCKRESSDTVSPAYPDWHTVTAPIDKEIQGVWGDWDKTLIISTMSELFRTTDQGKTWQPVHQSSIGIFTVVEYRDTLFTMTGLHGYKTVFDADHYSVDDGKTWQRYTRYNPVFDNAVELKDNAFWINPVTTSHGLTYRINQVFLDGPTATTGLYETPGVVTSDGRRIDLPQLHQLRSLYLDTKGRLYIAGTDAVCGRGHSGEKFAFCNSKNGRGVVYISKKPLP